MIKVNVKFDIQRAKRELDKEHRKIDKAAARAINRAIDSVKSAATKEIASLTKIKQKEIRRRLYVRGATPNRLIAEVEAYPYSPNLKDFRATQNKTGTAASAWERRKTYRHAFIHPKTRRVVTRTTESRYPLKGLRGPSVPKTFMQKAVLAKLEAVAKQRWRTEFEREIARRIGRRLG